MCQAIGLKQTEQEFSKKSLFIYLYISYISILSIRHTEPEGMAKKLQSVRATLRISRENLLLVYSVLGLDSYSASQPA